MMGIHITDSAVITAVFFYFLCVFIIMIGMAGNKTKFSGWEVKLFLICVLCVLIRGIFPIELSASKSVYLTSVYAELCGILRTQAGGFVTVKQILLFVWAAGIFVILIGKGMKLKRFHRFLSQGQVVQRITVAKKHGKQKDIPVIVIRYLDATFITGLIHPKIVLAESKRNDCGFLLRHEIEHYKNHDLWYKFFLEGVCTVYWWNPLTFFLRKYTNNLLELGTDLRIVKDVSEENRIKYAEMLVGAKSQKRLGNFSLGVSTARRFLKVRICSILNTEKTVRVKKRFFVFLLLVVCSFFVVLEPRGAAPEDETFDIESDGFYVREAGGSYHLYDESGKIGELDELPAALEKELK